MTARNPHDVRSVISVPRWLSLIASSPSLSALPAASFKNTAAPALLPLRILLKNQFGKRKHKTMRLLLFSLSLFCLLAVISAKKQIQENIDPIEAETKAHSSKKYSKEYQKAHHHGGHNHKKHQVLDQPKEVDPEPKPAHADIPEPEIRLQSDIETSKKAIEEEKQKAEVEDLHLQDLTYEETILKNKKKKKGHVGKVLKHLKEKDQKLFADQEEKNPVEEKVIEDSFEPLKETRNEAEKKNKGKDKKSKDKTKNKKAYEKNKDKSKKNGKDGKKKNNKDKKNKNNKDKKKW